MDPNVQVAAVGAVAVIIAAWLGRPSRHTRRSVKRIEEQFENNGGTTAKDALDRIEKSQERLAGRLDQHLIDARADKEAAHKEAIEMWSAIKAVAKSSPQGDQP